MSKYKGGFQIVALNTQGSMAIQEALIGDKKAKLEKGIAKGFIKITIISSNPLILEFLLENNKITRLSSIEDIKFTVMRSLRKNGASDEDFQFFDIENYEDE